MCPASSGAAGYERPRARKKAVVLPSVARLMADERSHTEFQALADDLRAMLARIKARDLEATTDG